MISVAVRLNDLDLDCWLDAVSNLATTRGVELPASLLAEPAEALEARLAANALRVLHVTRLLPSGFVMRLMEAAERPRDVLLAQVKSALARCRAVQVRQVSCDLELDAAGATAAQLEPAIRAQVSLIRQLLPVAVEAGQTLCIPVRQPPPYPGSREWSLASNVVHEIMHPSCRLALDLVPAELDPAFDLAALLRDCVFHLAVVRIHYEPFLGEAVPLRRQQEWADALRRQGFKGTVVFCPVASTPEGIRAACRQVDALAGLYA